MRGMHATYMALQSRVVIYDIGMAHALALCVNRLAWLLALAAVVHLVLDDDIG
jgi:hypothetical protein